MFCDIRTPRGEPFVGDPRFVLKRNLERLSRLGFTYYVGPELEFFYLKNADTPEPLDDSGYFDQLSGPSSADLRRDTVLNLAEMGIPVKYSHHEAARGQHEIDLQYTDALTMADSVMTAKLVIKELALLRGAYASFMPKPITGMNGSGMHTHQSLFQGNRNAFYDEDDEHHLSLTGKRFIAGLARHAPEITLVTNQWVNSYKRLVPGFEAPVYISWAHVKQVGPDSCACLQARVRKLGASGVSRAGPGLQPLSCLQRHAGGGSQGNRGGVPGAAAGGGQRVCHVDRRARVQKHQDLARQLGVGDNGSRG